MDKLEALVNSLEKLPPRENGKKDEKIAKKLQEILELFLRNYYVEFGTFKIDPILVEAYYYNDEQNFKDESVHAARNGKWLRTQEKDKKIILANYTYTM